MRTRSDEDKALPKHLEVKNCYNCEREFITSKTSAYIFCCVKCSEEYFKRKRGLI